MLFYYFYFQRAAARLMRLQVRRISKMRRTLFSESLSLGIFSPYNNRHNTVYIAAPVKTAERQALME